MISTRQIYANKILMMNLKVFKMEKVIVVFTSNSEVYVGV